MKSTQSKASLSLMEKIVIAEERARFEEAHARIVEAKLRRLSAKIELEKLTAKK